MESIDDQIPKVVPAINIDAIVIKNGKRPLFEQSIDDTNFAQYEGANGLKIGDEEYLTDYNKMLALGILITDTPADYWLASRFIEDYSTAVYFRMRCVVRRVGRN